MGLQMKAKHRLASTCHYGGTSAGSLPFRILPLQQRTTPTGTWTRCSQRRNGNLGTFTEVDEVVTATSSGRDPEPRARLARESQKDERPAAEIASVRQSSSNGSSLAPDDAGRSTEPLASSRQLEEPGASAVPFTSGNAGWVATLTVTGGVGLLLLGGYVFQDQIKSFLDYFIGAVEQWGPWGYVGYAAVYTSLEVLALPAIPLTMTAGVIFGPVEGTILVSVAATIAATIAFLLARYAARDKVLAWASRNPKFAAIDRAIGRDGLKFVMLLRLSPLLPLAASNYLYGLTSVDLSSYVIGTFFGMLPGTWAYVTTGHVGKAVLTEGEGALPLESWQIVLGLSVTLVALGFVGQLARKAIEEVDDEEQGSGI